MARAGFGLLIPARNEGSVLERKLRNCARLVWPATAGLRRVVVVDDNSDDDTWAVATSCMAQLRGEHPEVEWLLVEGPGCGKATAIERGVRALGNVELVVLTDADVVLREASLIALAEAFREDTDLILACGAQEFVRDLAEDGSTSAANGGAPQNASEFFDRITAKVRHWESRGGKLFSVHGQLMAWRPVPGLLPRPGFSADDLDLMFTVRSRGGGVRLVQGARFLEVKPKSGVLRNGQRRRRAEGYFHVLRAWSCLAPLGASWSSRVQWFFYAYVPALAPALLLLFVPAGLGLGWLLGGWRGACAVAAVWGLILISRLGREVLGLALVIDAARRAEPVKPEKVDRLLDRWEPPRAR
ncbi:MAG: hypothetical protein ACI8QS_003153 [Planctomycetota bacterium]|jgi:hypothetical protein